MSTKQIKLPKMPYGEGSMSLRPDGTIMYRKRIGEPKREKTVYGSTPKECIQKMKDEEALLRKKVVDQDKVSLVDAIAQFTDPTDFVISTSNRKTNTIKNMSDTIKAMEVEAETSVQSSNTHLLRHTCASL